MDANQQQTQQPQAVSQQQQVPVPYQPSAYPPQQQQQQQQQQQPPQYAPAAYPPAPQNASSAPQPAQPAGAGPTPTDNAPAAENTKAKEFDIKDLHKYITKQVALGIAGVMLLFSIIGMGVTINDISTVNNAIDSIFPFRTTFANDLPFGDVASSLRSELEKLRIYLFVYLATCIVQTLVSGAGLLAIVKNLPATHKLYLYGSGALVVVRIVLLFLLRVNGFSIFTMLLNAAILYAIWVYQGKIEASVASEAKETTEMA